MPHQSAQLLAKGEALRAQLAESDAAIGDASSNHSVAELASLLDEIEVGIWSLSAKTKRTLYVNPALVRLTGRPREAFPTENPSLIPWLHPNDQHAAHKVRDEVFETGRGNFLARLVRPDGEFRWCRFRSHVVRDVEAEAERVDILVLDVHDQVLAEQELQRNKRRLIRILDQNWDVLWTSGPERAFEVLGGSKREIGGWPVEVLFGKSAERYRHPDEIARLNERWAEIARTPGSTGKAELRIRSRNGDYIWVETIMTNLLEDPDVCAIVGATREIDERKRGELAIVQINAELERRVAEATLKLQDANTRLMQAVRAKDAFLANMSHELRTPLNGVLGFSEALQAYVYGPLSEKQLHVIQRIEQSGRHLLSLINDILDLAKIESGKAELELAPIVVTDVCHASLAMIEGAARSKNIGVSLQMADHFATFWVDERKLKQILVNLLGNAVKFTPKGGTVGLDVKVDSEQGTITFCVWDKGVGIAADDLPRLFQPFVQLDSSLSRAHNGTGLGLPLVRSMVDLHGGSVFVESERGQGSRFYVNLPMRRRGESNASKSTLHALIVEDSEPMSEQLKRYLQEMGFESVVCTDATAVVQYAAIEKPAVILLDILLPAPVGWDVLEQLRNDPRTTQIPVIVVSVLGSREKALALGAVDCLPKPVERERLQAAVKLVTARAATRTALIAHVDSCETSVNAPRILVAEDDEMNVHTMLEFLKHEGYAVYVARNGVEALELVHQLKPDIILMDIQMPQMDGLSAIRALKADPSAEIRKIPIIALTALAMKTDREQCLQAGAEVYLTKPVGLKQLLSYIKKCMG